MRDAFLGFAAGPVSDRAHGAPEGVRIAIGTVLARRVHELLALGARVFGSLHFFFAMGPPDGSPTVGDLRLHREVRMRQEVDV